MDLKDKKILLTGAAGFLGKQVYKKLVTRGVLETNIAAPNKETSDLRDREVCDRLTNGIDVVIHVAGTVGGIGFNKEHPAEAFYDNAAMALNLIDSSYRAGVKKFVGVGTVCEYPKFSPVPFKEDDLWNGYPEETNAPYGLAKKMMLVGTQAYRQQYGFNGVHLLMINLYGPGDSFDTANSHVIAALVKKFCDAVRENKPYVEVWGTGSASRDFLYVEDAAEGIVLAAENYDKPEPINIGSGKEIFIKDLAETIKKLAGFTGELRWDSTKPDGQPRRGLDVTRAEKEFGFKSMTDFETGLKNTIDWYNANYGNLQSHS
ncbi:MAG: GDP-L-fucose synthase [Patescibacteria group bacterium]